MFTFLREITGADTQFAAKWTPPRYPVYHSSVPALVGELLGEDVHLRLVALHHPQLRRRKMS